MPLVQQTYLQSEPSARLSTKTTRLDICQWCASNRCHLHRHPRSSAMGNRTAMDRIYSYENFQRDISSACTSTTLSVANPIFAHFLSDLSLITSGAGSRSQVTHEAIAIVAKRDIHKLIYERGVWRREGMNIPDIEGTNIGVVGTGVRRSNAIVTGTINTALVTTGDLASQTKHHAIWP